MIADEECKSMLSRNSICNSLAAKLRGLPPDNAGQMKQDKPRSTMLIAKFESTATAPGSVEPGSYIVQGAKVPKIPRQMNRTPNACNARDGMTRKLRKDLTTVMPPYAWEASSCIDIVSAQPSQTEQCVPCRCCFSDS
jgi:hypothetical protein